MERRTLESDEIGELLVSTLPTWSAVDGKLKKQFRFRNFATAIGWMMSVSIIAEKMDHHPEWSNVYNRVTVALTTHDKGNRVTTWDVALAVKMDELANGTP